MDGAVLGTVAVVSGGGFECDDVPTMAVTARALAGGVRVAMGGIGAVRKETGQSVGKPS